MQGDPSAVPAIVDNVKSLLGTKPMFGICMGHQILGQAAGGSTFKLKFGHHGGNHPIRYDATGELPLRRFKKSAAISVAWVTVSCVHKSQAHFALITSPVQTSDIRSDVMLVVG